MKSAVSLLVNCAIGFDGFISPSGFCLGVRACSFSVIFQKKKIYNNNHRFKCNQILFICHAYLE